MPVAVRCLRPRSHQRPVTLRLGATANLRQHPQDTVHVAGRVTVADARGPFGNPTSDSARALVTTATREALVVVYAPASTPASTLTRVLDLTAGRVIAAVGGQEDARWMA
jgi:DNA/RNA-binding domain of Phe-tRNA-synthetase-like protein